MDRGTSIFIAVVAGALGGFGGGLAAGWTRPRPPEVKPVPAGESALPSELRELGTQVKALEAEVARLRQQRRTPSAEAPAPPPSAGAPRAPAAADDPVFEAAVRDVMDRIQQERASEREDRRAQAVPRWADRLAEKLQLTDAQRASALIIAEELAQKLRDLREADGGPGSGGSFREARDALRAQGEQRLSEVLSARQMATYRESNDLQIDAVWRGGGRRREQP